MKKWLKIWAGTSKSTPEEITKELDDLKTEQSGVKTKLTDAKESLAQARVELFGGSGDQAGVDALEGDVKNLQIQVDTLNRAISDLEVKHGEAIERERQDQVKAIDKKIDDLRQWVAEIRPEYVRAKVVVEAYERLFTTPSYLNGYAASREALLVTGKERAQHQAEFDAITQGHGSLMTEIKQLQKQKQTILEQ